MAIILDESVLVTEAERELIRKVGQKESWAHIETVERFSPRTYDIGLSGQYQAGPGVADGFSAWLPLATIRAGNWPRLASLSNYPRMVRQGDWSGIRDSSEEAIWDMLSATLRQRWLHLL